jgi:hypothetical protein
MGERRGPQACPRCGTTTKDALCVVCVQQVATIIDEMPDLVADLAVTETRQAVGPRQPGHRDKGDAMPLPFTDSPKIAAAHQNVAVFIAMAESVAKACRYPTLRQASSVTPPANQEHARARTAAEVLRRNIGYLRVSPEAAEAAESLRIIRASLLAAIDRRPVRIHAGPCGAPVEVLDVRAGDEGAIKVGVTTQPCEAPLYAEPGVKALTCSRCGATHSPADRHAFQLAALRGEVLPLDEALVQIERLVGITLDRALIRKWRQRRRLVACVNGAGVESFRVGDLISLGADQVRRPGPRRRVVSA